MLELYRTKNENVHRKTEILLERKLGKNFEIKKNENGKPYVVGEPLYFSISHSRGVALIALCDRPVGIDFEFYAKNGENKNFAHILNRFTEREKQWLGGAPGLFFLNWVSKEAYIKMRGGTLARELKRLEYFNDALYFDGKQINCGLYAAEVPDAGVYAICANGYTREQLSGCKIRLFRLKKGERII